MADNSANSNGILGVVIGAIIVLLVGGGILYATGVIDPQPTNVTIQQPAATAEKDADRSRWDGRDNDRRGDRWDGRRDDDRGDRGDERDRDNDRRGDRSERR